MSAPLKRDAALALTALLTSSATLVCCVLPAGLVALGAGAALAGVVGAMPQLVWLSEQKALVFGAAASMLALAGIALWRSRALPCPADAAQALACRRLRNFSATLYVLALLAFCVGFMFAFVLPRFAA